MDRAPADFDIRGRGIVTTVDFPRSILRRPAFRAGTHATDLIDHFTAVRGIRVTAPEAER
jgi:pyruvate carboxylase